MAFNQNFLAVPAAVYERIDWSDGLKVEDEVKCPECQGSGRASYWIITGNCYTAPIQTCRKCKGTGKIKN